MRHCFLRLSPLPCPTSILPVRLYQLPLTNDLLRLLSLCFLKREDPAAQLQARSPGKLGCFSSQSDTQPAPSLAITLPEAPRFCGISGIALLALYTSRCILRNLAKRAREDMAATEQRRRIQADQGGCDVAMTTEPYANSANAECSDTRSKPRGSLDKPEAWLLRGNLHRTSVSRTIPFF